MTSIYMNPYLFGQRILVPAGIVILFNPAVADIPADYLFCDGTSGTQDLRDKYIRGADGSTILVNATGGATTGQVTGTTASDGAHGSLGAYSSGNGGGGGSRTGTGNSVHSHAMAGDMDWAPPSRELIAIKSTVEAPLPVGAVLWRDSGEVPNQCSELTAMRNRFALCVSGDSRTQIGSDTRSMTVAVTSGGSHGHSGVADGYDAPGGGGGLVQAAAGAHTHTGVTESHTIAKPPFLALLCVKVDAETGAFDQLVAMYDGDLGDLPDEWELFTDIVGKMPIGAGDVYDVGDTGGQTSSVSITGTDSIPSFGGSHAHGSPTEEGVNGDHPSHTWTHSHASWSGSADPMPPWHGMYFIKYAA